MFLKIKGKKKKKVVIAKKNIFNVFNKKLNPKS